MYEYLGDGKKMVVLAVSPPSTPYRLRASCFGYRVVDKGTGMLTHMLMQGSEADSGMKQSVELLCLRCRE